MEHYEDTYEEAKCSIEEVWVFQQLKPSLFAYVQTVHGRKYMTDYSFNYYRPGIEPIEDLMCRVDSICSAIEPKAKAMVDAKAHRR